VLRWGRGCPGWCRRCHWDTLCPRSPRSPGRRTAPSCREFRWTPPQHSKLQRHPKREHRREGGNARVNDGCWALTKIAPPSAAQAPWAGIRIIGYHTVAWVGDHHTMWSQHPLESSSTRSACQRVLGSHRLVAADSCPNSVGMVPVSWFKWRALDALQHRQFAIRSLSSTPSTHAPRISQEFRLSTSKLLGSHQV
jgi:hypothetical protein